MADAARARSEARRKKILENAEKRINRLYSRQQEENDNNCMIFNKRSLNERYIFMFVIHVS